MESHQEFSLSESEGKEKRKRRKRVVIVGKNAVLRQGGVTTADGEEMSYDTYATKVMEPKEIQLRTRDVGEVFRQEKKDSYQGTRYDKQQRLMRERQKEHYATVEKKRFNKSGYINSRTEEGIMAQELERIRNENAKIYENGIRERISDLGSEIHSISRSRKKVPTLGRYQMTLSILLAILLKPFNFEELMEFLDGCIKSFNPELPYRFSNDAKKVLHTLWVIQNDNPEKRYMRKFILAQGNGDCVVRDIKFSMNPHLMKMAATDYHDLRRAWFVRLPKGDEHISESQLLDFVPELKTCLESPHHGSSPESTSPDDVIVDDDGLTDELRKIKFQNEGNRRRIEKKARDEFYRTSDIKKQGVRRMPKGEFMGHVMVSNDTIIMTKMEWHDVFLKRLKQLIKGKQSVSFKDIHNSETYNFFRKIENPETPINKFIYKAFKSAKRTVFGFHPILSRVKDIYHITTMVYSVKEGNKLIEEYTTEGRSLHDVEIEKVLYPERFETSDKEKLEPEELLDDVKTVELTTEVMDETEGLDIQEVEKVDPMEKLANSINKIADAINKIADGGVSINFNIGFGTKSEVNNGQLKTTDDANISKMTEVLEVVEHSNKGLEIAVERMGLVLDSVNELVSLLK